MPTPRTIPSEAADALVSIGAGLRTARLRRRLTAADLAARVGVSLPTLRKLERGDPSVSLGSVAAALWILGLLPPVREAVAPENDSLGAALDAARAPERVRRRPGPDLDRL